MVLGGFALAAVTGAKLLTVIPLVEVICRGGNNRLPACLVGSRVLTVGAGVRRVFICVRQQRGVSGQDVPPGGELAGRKPA